MEELLEAIDSGRALAPPGGRWDSYALLAVAGACHFAAMSHGAVELPPVDVERLPKEYREAKEETFFEDLSDAIRFYSQLTMMVKDGKYDHMEPELEAVIYSDADGKHVIPVKGFKGTD